MSNKFRYAFILFFVSGRRAFGIPRSFGVLCHPDPDLSWTDSLVRSERYSIMVNRERSINLEQLFYSLLTTHHSTVQLLMNN